GRLPRPAEGQLAGGQAMEPGSNSARLRLRRETTAYLNGAPVELGSASPRGKMPLGLPPWAAELKGGHFQGLVLDGGELFLADIHQQRQNDGRMLSLVTSLQVDSKVMDMIAQGLGRVQLRPEDRLGNQADANTAASASEK